MSEKQLVEMTKKREQRRDEVREGAGLMRERRQRREGIERQTSWGREQRRGEIDNAIEISGRDCVLEVVLNDMY